MLIIWVALAAMTGGIVNALLGWLQTTDPFLCRKFAASVVASLIGAVVVGVSFNFTGIEPGNLIGFFSSLFVAFLSGAGVSAGASRVSGAISNR